MDQLSSSSSSSVAIPLSNERNIEIDDNDIISNSDNNGENTRQEHQKMMTLPPLSKRADMSDFQLIDSGLVFLQSFHYHTWSEEKFYIMFPRFILIAISSTFEQILSENPDVTHKGLALNKDELKLFAKIAYYYYNKYIDPSFGGGNDSSSDLQLWTNEIEFQNVDIKEWINIGEFLTDLELKDRENMIQATKYVLEKYNITVGGVRLSRSYDTSTFHIENELFTNKKKEKNSVK